MALKQIVGISEFGSLNGIQVMVWPLLLCEISSFISHTLNGELLYDVFVDLILQVIFFLLYVHKASSSGQWKVNKCLCSRTREHPVFAKSRSSYVCFFPVIKMFYGVNSIFSSQ